MKVGDLVKVRLRASPEKLKVGIVVRLRSKMYMAGNIVEIAVDGKIKYVRQEHVEIL